MVGRDGAVRGGGSMCEVLFIIYVMLFINKILIILLKGHTINHSAFNMRFVVFSIKHSVSLVI